MATTSVSSFFAVGLPPPTPEEEADILRSFDPTLSEGNDLRGWIMHLTGTKNLSAQSVNRKISSVKSLYRYLRKKELSRVTLSSGSVP
ncbi:MAG: site-specific integrase [Alistipes indistinctus]